ncbi:hypothetical protein RHGRI_038050 [Rhododendron griersonianum]|uniref:Uncharacterized protein n=1 Tax=Rhododendron griersonianum TaxID=479676 RepID=A0AAV6HX07_9ERIC|nr:hypothetical protein RHGRI_038050 [Rhododendron griersonianum]
MKNPKLRFSALNCLKCLIKTLAISGAFLYFSYVIFFTQSYFPASEFYSPVQHIFAATQTTPPPHGDSPTNISGLVGSLKGWRHRKAYIESWWRPNVTRGYLYLDTAPTEELLPWSAASPQFRVSDDISKIAPKELLRHIRIVHTILEMDLRGDISGFLSSHPQAPLMSLHHFDIVDPIFPSMNRFQSTNHLMKSAKVDQSRLLQQTICYHKPTNWSISVSWGYSAHIYEMVIPKPILKRPLETFKSWHKLWKAPLYMFNTRWPPYKDSCRSPHVFFMESIENSGRNQIVATYVRSAPRGCRTCSFSGNHSADYISRVRVLSPATKLIRVIFEIQYINFYAQKLCFADELH